MIIIFITYIVTCIPAKEMSDSEITQRQYTSELEQIADKLRDVGDDRRRGEQIIPFIIYMKMLPPFFHIN